MKLHDYRPFPKLKDQGEGVHDMEGTLLVGGIQMIRNLTYVKTRC